MTTLGYLDRSVRVLDSDGQIPARSVCCPFPDMWVINSRKIPVPKYFFESDQRPSNYGNK